MAMDEKRLFDLDQSQLEKMCEKLSGMVDSPLDHYCYVQTDKHLDLAGLHETNAKFYQFKESMIQYTTTTAEFRSKLIISVEERKEERLNKD